MITMKEVLRLPELQSAVVRTGMLGLERDIHWAHVIDHDDVGYFLEGRELLLTCGQIWPKDLEAQSRLLNMFLTHEISGIIFAVGRYLDECPEVVLEFGEKYAIPIIEVPFHIQFVKVTRSIHQEILKRQYNKEELATHIPLKLLEQLRKVNRFSEVCDTLALHFECPIMMTDSHHKIMVQSIPRNEKSIHISKFSKKLMDEIKNCFPPKSQNLMVSMEDEVQTLCIPTDSSPYITGLPIQCENEYYGSLWIFSLYKHIDPGQIRIIQHAVAILKEQILCEKDKEAKRRQLQSELLELLLEKPKIASVLLKDKMNQLSLVAEEKWAAGLVTFAGNKGFSSNSTESSSLYDLCNRWLNETQGVSGFCEYFKGKLIIILTFSKEQSLLDYDLKSLQRLLSERLEAILLLGGVKNELFSLKESYKESVSLASLIPNDGSTEEMYLADQYRREIMLYGSMDSVQAQDLRNLIMPKELLTEQGKIFYDTLRCLTLNKYNRDQAAKALHIHRSTLRYRIEKIEQYLGESLNSLRCQFWIQVAFDLESKGT